MQLWNCSFEPPASAPPCPLWGEGTAAAGPPGPEGDPPVGGTRWLQPPAARLRPPSPSCHRCLSLPCLSFPAFALPPSALPILALPAPSLPSSPCPCPVLALPVPILPVCVLILPVPASLAPVLAVPKYTCPCPCPLTSLQSSPPASHLGPGPRVDLGWINCRAHPAVEHLGEQEVSKGTRPLPITHKKALGHLQPRGFFSSERAPSGN